MSLFSRRHGYGSVRLEQQIGDLDAETRRVLWNGMHGVLEVLEQRSTDGRITQIRMGLWTGVLRGNRDEFPNHWGVEEALKHLFFNEPWFLVFDALESLVQHIFAIDRLRGDVGAVTRLFNEAFEREMVGYRFIDRQIVELHASEQVDAVAAATETLRTKHQDAAKQLDAALRSFGDRHSPNYRDAIVNAVTAVETVARFLYGGSTLGEALNRIPKDAPEYHAALVSSWRAYFGWASDTYRHGKTGVADPSQAMAQYAIVASSAFVTLLVAAANS